MSYGPFNPTTGGSQDIQVNGTLNYVLVLNTSDYNFTLVFNSPSPSQPYGVPARQSRMFRVPGNRVNMVWSNPILTVTNPAATQTFSIEVYDASDYQHVELTNLIPAQLGVTQQVSVQSVINDGNASTPSPTVVVESTPLTASGSTLYEDNAGHVIFRSFLASVLQTQFEINPSNGAFNLFGISGTDLITFLDHAGVTRFIFDVINGIFNPTIKTQQKTGDAGGTITLYEWMGGTLKSLFITEQSSFKQTGAANPFTLINGYSIGCIAFNVGCDGQAFKQNGVSAAISQITWGTGGAAGSSTSVTSLQPFSSGFANGQFNQVGTNGGDATSHAGYMFVIGV